MSTSAGKYSSYKYHLRKEATTHTPETTRLVESVEKGDGKQAAIGKVVARRKREMGSSGIPKVR